MLLPSVSIKRSRSRGFCTGALRWRGTVERAVHARSVVIVPKCIQLPHQIRYVPEEDAVEIFSANGADQPFDERMRNRCVEHYHASLYWIYWIDPKNDLICIGTIQVMNRWQDPQLHDIDAETAGQQGGMYENFDATTGDGLRDPAYTWTSNVYLMFAHQLLSGRD